MSRYNGKSLETVYSFVLVNPRLQVANKCKGTFIVFGVTFAKISFLQYKILSPIVYFCDSLVTYLSGETVAKLQVPSAFDVSY